MALVRGPSAQLAARRARGEVGVRLFGAGARDVISILQAMKEAGALEADVEVL